MTALPASVSWNAGDVDEETSQPICTRQIYRRSAEREGNEGVRGTAHTGTDRTFLLAAAHRSARTTKSPLDDLESAVI